MEVELIFKIAAVGILVSVISQILKHSGREEHAFLTSLAGLIGNTGVILAILLKQWKSDFSMYISIATSFLIIVLVSSKIQYIINAFNTFNKFLDSNGSYVGLLLKMAGITYVSEFASGICKDSGYSAVASQIEIFARISMLVISLPVVITLLETIRGL